MKYKNYLEVVYPIEKRKVEIYIPWVIVQRILSIPFLGLSILLKISPNFISFISIFLIFSASFLMFLDFFISGILVLTLAVIFDCVDGELARVTKKTSILGERLEHLAADLFSMIGIPSIAIWLFIYNDLSILILFFCFLAATSHVFIRNFFQFDSNVEIKKTGFLGKILLSQSKEFISINDSSLFISIMFFLKMNLVTQDGILFFVIILSGIFYPQNLSYLVILVSISQIFFVSLIIFGSIAKNRITLFIKD
tara:strand:+ start:881 stop:1639 length:759 start_codon:yes stop_codon:yes gene_type:complete